MKIHYLGPSGTYSEIAAKKAAGKNPKLIPQASLDDVAKAVSESKEAGVIPYYNYIIGFLENGLDILRNYRLKKAGEVRVPIIFALGGRNNGKIYSHIRALEQCCDYLNKNYGESERIPVSSTAAGVIKVKKSKNGLAIANIETLKKYKLEIIANDIGNRVNGAQNYSDFYVISSC